jgi:hypothetical protein
MHLDLGCFATENCRSLAQPTNLVPTVAERSSVAIKPKGLELCQAYCAVNKSYAFVRVGSLGYCRPSGAWLAPKGRGFRVPSLSLRPKVLRSNIFALRVAQSLARNVVPPICFARSAKSRVARLLFLSRHRIRPLSNFCVAKVRPRRGLPQRRGA